MHSFHAELVNKNIKIYLRLISFFYIDTVKEFYIHP